MTPTDEPLTTERELPTGVGVVGPTAWHRLDPLTRLVISVATAVAVISTGGLVCPLVIGLAAVVIPAQIAGVLPTVVRMSLLLALPLALSAALVNIFFTPGGEPVLTLGPLTITEQGVEVAVEVVVRVFVMAGAATLFYITTRPAELVASLGSHGVRPQLTFIVHNAVAMIPRLSERASEVIDAQRARGLDTEGNPIRRVRGLLALTSPTVVGAIAEAEVRTLALETRGFTRPGPRTSLWAPRDSRVQRVARWAIVAGLGLLIAASVGGVLPC